MAGISAIYIYDIVPVENPRASPMMEMIKRDIEMPQHILLTSG